jgi:hypothetical protein
MSDATLVPVSKLCNIAHSNERQRTDEAYVRQTVHQRGNSIPSVSNERGWRSDTSFLFLKLMPIYITRNACLRQKEKVSPENHSYPSEGNGRNGGSLKPQSTQRMTQLRVSNFDQFSPRLSPISPAAEEKRSPQLVAEAERLMDDLYKKIFAGGPRDDEVHAKRNPRKIQETIRQGNDCD